MVKKWVELYKDELDKEGINQEKVSKDEGANHELLIDSLLKKLLNL